MPEQRRAARRFADDVARHPPRAHKAEGFERGAGGWVGDEFGEYGVDTYINHAAGGALLFTLFLALGVEELVGDLAQATEHIVVEDVFYQAVAVADELVEVFFGTLLRHLGGFPFIFSCEGRRQTLSAAISPSRERSCKS